VTPIALTGYLSVAFYGSLQTWWWCYPTPPEDGNTGEFRKEPALSLATPPKIWTRNQKWKK